MKLNKQLDRAIRDLRSEHRQDRRPPLEIERMHPALRDNSRRPKTKRGFLTMTVAAIAIVLLFGYFRPFPHKTSHTESASEAAFLSLPSATVLPASPNTTYVRIRLHRSDLRQFGLDISEIDEKQIVQAEFALGDDGLARAVRLVDPFHEAGAWPVVVHSR